MNFTVVQPPQHLTDYVRFFWFLEGNATKAEPYIHRTLAEPCPELIFYYRGQFKYESGFQSEKILTTGVYGQTQHFNKVATTASFGLFGTYLYPYALPQLFCMPASEVTNLSLDIKTLCGKEGEILEERIMLASDNHQRVKLVSDFLKARLKNVRTEYRGIFSSIKTISNASQLPSIQFLADNHCLSVRQFERKFKEFSGFSPKLFLRIVRFNSIIKNTILNKSLTQIACECGYYDQSHFIHDFKTFSGYNPKEYFKETIVADYRASSEFKK